MKRDSEHEHKDAHGEIEVYAELAERLASGGRTYGAAIMVGICAGILFAVGGIVLALLGISGAVEFVIESTSINARLTNASPGVVVAAMGMIIIWRYKPRLTHDVELRPRGFRSRGEAELPAGFSEAEHFLRDRDDPTFRSKGKA